MEKMNRREIDILYIMWNAGKPLMASEIANSELTLPTVHTTLKRMLKKNMVEVVSFAKSGKVYGRCYQPTMGLKEYELDKLSKDFKSKMCQEITISGLTEILLEDLDGDALLKELEQLEQLIKEKRISIK